MTKMTKHYHKGRMNYQKRVKMAKIRQNTTKKQIKVRKAPKYEQKERKNYQRDMSAISVEEV